MEGGDLLTYIGTAMAGGISWFFASNIKLREALSDTLLKHLNKAKINKIPLENHRLFGALHQKRSVFTYFILDEPVKIEFYKRYVSIAFDSLEIMANEVVVLSNDTADITTAIFNAMDMVIDRIDIELERQLIIPTTIENNFAQWRSMLSASFKDSLIEILNDDLIDSNYFLAYRTLDAMISNVKTILHSGALEFSRINGAFKNLTVKDILRQYEDKPISE